VAPDRAVSGRVPARNWRRVLVYAGALAPLALLVWRAATDKLGANPNQAIAHLTGTAAFVLLLLSLACTPLGTLFQIGWLRAVRRTLGLYAFAYATLHVLNFVALDYGFDFSLMRRDGVAHQPWVLSGATAYVILLLLALTSTAGWVRRLGPWWRRLHRLVYLAALLVAAHRLLVPKVITWEPMLYGAIVAVLLLARLPAVNRRLPMRA
jgi:methionine sulfoxide reductase heme-binding subunit